MYGGKIREGKTMLGMAARYTRNFKIGRSTHLVEVYEGYTEDDGLVGTPLIVRESTRIRDCLKGLPLNKTMIDRLRMLARVKEDMVVHPDGTVTNF